MAIAKDQRVPETRALRIAYLLKFDHQRAGPLRLGAQIPESYKGKLQRMIAGVRDRLKGRNPLFLITVAIPSTLSLLYFGVLASDVYISESKFVVRSPEKNATSGLGIILKSAGFANAGDEIYAAQTYVVSRDALHSLNRGNAFEKAYANGSISIFDRFNPTGLQGSFEDLYRYYTDKVSVEHDSSSSITTLTVRAYDPRQAQRFNEQLLEMAETTVNRLNVRGRQDLIRFAQTEVDDAKAKDRDAAVALAAYRNKAGVVDPEKQAVVQTQMISKLQDELIATKTELLQLRKYTPRNPQIDVMQTRASGLEKEIGEQMRMVAGDRKSLAGAAVQYQRLQLEAQFADKQLASALASLEEARNEARRKQAYVERIVQPNTPDDALEPRRLRGILATLLLGLVAWGVFSMLLAGVREHVE